MLFYPICSNSLILITNYLFQSYYKQLKFISFNFEFIRLNSMVLP